MLLAVDVAELVEDEVGDRLVARGGAEQRRPHLEIEMTRHRSGSHMER